MPRAPIVLALVMILAAGAAQAQPRYRADSAGRVVQLTGLTPKNDCSPATLRGRVVARSFNQTGILPASVTIEEADGSRSYVNIDTDDVQAVNMADRSWLLKGLQTMLRDGNRVTLGVWLCGAAGRVMMLHSVR